MDQSITSELRNLLLELSVKEMLDRFSLIIRSAAKSSSEAFDIALAVADLGEIYRGAFSRRNFVDSRVSLTSGNRIKHLQLTTRGGDDACALNVSFPIDIEGDRCFAKGLWQSEGSSCWMGQRG